MAMLPTTQEEVERVESLIGYKFLQIYKDAFLLNTKHQDLVS